MALWQKDVSFVHFLHKDAEERRTLLCIDHASAFLREVHLI